MINRIPAVSEVASVTFSRMIQSELPRPIPWNSVEIDHGCTSRIYFDNVTLTLHNMKLTSQKPCQHNIINEVNVCLIVFFSVILLKNT